MTTTRIKAEGFPDLADEVIYPRILPEKMAWLAEKGERRSFAPGEVLYEQGLRDAPFFVIESGRVDFIDHKPGKEIWIAEADAGTFIGDIATFTGEPAMAECVAAEETDTIAFDREGLRAMLAAKPEMGELVLGTLLARRAWHEGAGHGVLRLIAERGSRRAFEVRDLLERNLVPLQFHDVDLDPYADKILDWLDIARDETPVLVRYDRVLRNPSAAQLARELGLRAEVDGQRFDLVVLGGGPAGLAAAVSGGSEGLSHVRGRGLGAGRPGGHQQPDRELPGLPQRDLGSRADPRRHPSGPPLRRGPVELPPGRRADRRPRRAGSRRPRRRPARPGPGRGDGHRGPLAGAGRPRHRPLPGRRALPRRHAGRRRALP